ncbi:hypothetical protein NQ318_001741 [Aromia moschata]|uniref:Uncharacterized protein n=1 Tax=Aromia moschata TaxID=1265417 RepID=A0AAV8XTK9_9CUCU|nr:hypothetical protein NQ318_001741 [Aromia moschata]
MTVESSMSLLTDVDVDVASSLEGISTVTNEESVKGTTDPSTAATLRSVDSGSESPEDIAEAKGDADMTARTIPLREVEGKTELKEA